MTAHWGYVLVPPTNIDLMLESQKEQLSGQTHVTTNNFLNAYDRLEFPTLPGTANHLSLGLTQV